MRTPQTAAGKGGKGKGGGGDDDTHTSFHGVVFLNLAPLLYPGVKRIRGAYRVHAYTDADVVEKVRTVPYESTVPYLFGAIFGSKTNVFRSTIDMSQRHRMLFTD